MAVVSRERAGVLCGLVAILAAFALVLSLVADTLAGCGETCQQRVQTKQWQATWRAAPPAMRAHLRRIAQCESGGDHRAVSAGGTYRGLLQFDYGTWASVGGRGDPAAAPRWEQWARGVRLYRARGPAPWPVCRFR